MNLPIVLLILALFAFIATNIGERSENRPGLRPVFIVLIVCLAGYFLYPVFAPVVNILFAPIAAWSLGNH